MEYHLRWQTSPQVLPYIDCLLLALSRQNTSTWPSSLLIPCSMDGGEARHCDFPQF